MSTQRWMLTALLILAALAPAAAASLDHPAASPAAEAQPASTGSMLIVENAGQWPDAARFQVWGGPGTVWLAEDAIWISIPAPTSPPPPSLRGKGESEPEVRYSPHLAGKGVGGLGAAGVNLKLTFPGANPHPRIEPLNPLTTTVSYFLGNDPARWRSGVPVYGRVRYVDLYPGVTLEIADASGEWSWRLTADGSKGQHGGAVATPILHVEGASAAVLEGDILRLATASGEIRLPLLADNVDVRVDNQAIRAQAAGSPDSLPAAFSARPATSPANDPTDLIYATYLGGAGDDFVGGLALDAMGRVYVAGTTHSDNFPVTPGAFANAFGGYSDVLVARFNAAGSRLEYATFLGGGSLDYGYAISLDAGGRATVTGSTWSCNFPTTPGAFDTTYGGGYGDAFIARLSSDGSVLDYATFLGGGAGDSGNAIAVDSAGNAHVMGSTSSHEFPTTPGAFDPTFNGVYSNSDDAFVACLDDQGSALVYSTFLGGQNYDYGQSIVVDGSGRSYVAGYTGSQDFPTTLGAFDRDFGGGWSDVFAARLNASGSALDYATFLGGSDGDYVPTIATDNLGRAYLAGATSSPDFPTTPGAFDRSFNGVYDAFVVRLNPSGSGLDYGTLVGGDGPDANLGVAIVVDDMGRVHLTGNTTSADFPTTPGAFDVEPGGSQDAFVARLDVDASALEYSTFLGGNSDDQGFVIALDNAGRVYVAGKTYSSDFPTTAGAFDTTYNLRMDAFAAKLDLNPEYSGRRLFLPMILR